MKESPQNPVHAKPDGGTIQPREKTAREREIEIIKRRLKTARAMIEEGLSRLEELEAA